MSKKASKPPKRLEDQIKPILEKLTFEVLKNKPEDIVSIYNFTVFEIATIYVRLSKKNKLFWVK